MAKASFTREPAPEPPATFTLELNEEETSFLHGTLGATVGSPGWEIFQALKNAIIDAGIDPLNATHIAAYEAASGRRG